MTQDKIDILLEKTDMMAKRQEQKEDRNEKFLPISFWTD